MADEKRRVRGQLQGFNDLTILRLIELSDSLTIPRKRVADRRSELDDRKRF